MMGGKGKKDGKKNSDGKKKAGKGKKGAKGGKKGKKGKGKKGMKGALAVNWRVKAMYGSDRDFDQMTNELKDLVMTYRQSSPMTAMKQGVAAAIKREFTDHFEKVDVVLVGSSSSQLAFDWTDVDLTILTHNQTSLEAKDLTLAAQVLANQGCISQIMAEETDISEEHVTIGFHYRTYLCGFRVHLSINDVSSVFHSHLIHCYHQIDNRLLFILLPIKQWAYNEGLLDPQEGKLSGYLITLMTIFYLQAGHITPVLPSLQKSAAKLFQKDLKNIKTWKELQTHKRLKVKSQNDSGIGKLLVGFFVYYQPFDFQALEIDVVTGQVRPRVLQDANYKHIRIAIRDPFEDRIASAFVTQLSFVDHFKNKLAQMEDKLTDPDRKEDLEEVLQFAGNTRREEVRGQFQPSVPNTNAMFSPRAKRTVRAKKK